MNIQRKSACKVNFLLNILGKRADGFHELETLLVPLPLWDELEFEPRPTAAGISMECDHPLVPAGPENLACRAAARFIDAASIRSGLRIRLVKNLPVAAGIGAGSANAAAALLALNELWDFPLTSGQLLGIAAELGSDVPFFLQDRPALGIGRGEQITPLQDPWPAFQGVWILLAHPGFGVSTAWAYQALARHPDSLEGSPGRAARLADSLASGTALDQIASEFYNSLEAPVLAKFPILALYQKFLAERGAVVARMSGSGSATFALAESEERAARLAEAFQGEFGPSVWLATASLDALARPEGASETKMI
jgi:4-diphosphocytidyl-2-C-methyl-D-erythritol kinase